MGVLSYLSIAQENTNCDPSSYILTVYVNQELTNDQIAKVEYDLKSSELVIKIIKTDPYKGLIMFEMKSKELRDISPLFNKYFSTYQVFEYNDVIYSVNNELVIPEHYPKKLQLNDQEKEEIIFQEELDAWKRNYPWEWEEYQKQIYGSDNEIK